MQTLRAAAVITFLYLAYCVMVSTAESAVADGNAITIFRVIALLVIAAALGCILLFAQSVADFLESLFRR